MKQTEKNEIDLLLRGLAKRGEHELFSRASQPGTETTSAHLDADELSAFAERTLTAAARTRYMTHLVDCSRCRKIVSELTAATGLPVTESEIGVRAGNGFWQKLGVLLSPTVLRYAVPALTALAVITVSVVLLRQQRSADLVAQNQEPVSSQPALGDARDKLDNTETGAQVTSTPPGGPSPNNGTGRDESAKLSAKGEVSDDRGNASASTTAAKDVSKPAPTESQTAFAPEPAPAPPVTQPQTGVVADAKKTEELAKQKEKAAAGAVSSERDESSNTVAANRELTGLSARKPAPAGRGGGVQAMETRRAETEQSRRADEGGETRSIEGRRFRRQGSVWVDTAYDASRPAMTLVRGSEQYRVLVADEPGIHSIAEKLSGEVIVVWKSRAYRIR